MNELAIVILNWNGACDTIECLMSLEKQNCGDIYLLDNGSEINDIKKLIQYIENSTYSYTIFASDVIDFRDTKVLNFLQSKENRGFAGGNNYVVNQIKSKYKYILLLNNDTVVPSGTINSMLNTIVQNDFVAVTCDIRYFSDKSMLWNAGGIFTWYGDRKYFSQKYIDRIEENGKSIIVVDYITGCAFLVDSQYIIENGLFSDKFFHGEEDYNFCMNAKKRKYKVGVDLSVRLYHKVGRSLRADGNSKKTFNATTVHYSNRIIDYKDFMSPSLWWIWREFYLCLIFIRRSCTNMGCANAYRLTKRIRRVTKQSDSLNKELFEQIMNS